jgi:hypothetical protein
MTGAGHHQQESSMKRRIAILGVLAAICLRWFGAAAQPQDGQSKDEIHVLFIGKRLSTRSSGILAACFLARLNSPATPGTAEEFLEETKASSYRRFSLID